LAAINTRLRQNPKPRNWKFIAPAVHRKAVNLSSNRAQNKK
jgi:hypothetical protein